MAINVNKAKRLLFWSISTQKGLVMFGNNSLNFERGNVPGF